MWLTLVDQSVVGCGALASGASSASDPTPPPAAATVSDEAVSELLPQVAQVAVNESVEAFLLERRGEKAFGYIAMDLFSDEFPGLLTEALAEADLEIAVDGVLDEVMVEMLTHDTEEALAGLEKDKRIAVRQDDMRIIGGHLLDGMAKRMLLGHLMMSIANNFEEVCSTCSTATTHFIHHIIPSLTYGPIHRTPATGTAGAPEPSGGAAVHRTSPPEARDRGRHGH